MTLGEFVGQKYAEGIKFSSFQSAVEAYRAAHVCLHTNTVFGTCADCDYVLNVEGTFKVNPDKTRYLTATPQVRSVLRATEEGTESE